LIPPQEQVVAPFLLRQSNQAQQAHPSNLPSTKSKLQPSLFFWRITQEAKQQQSSSLLSLFCHFSFFHQEQAELLLSIVSFQHLPMVLQQSSKPKLQEPTTTITHLFFQRPSLARVVEDADERPSRPGFESHRSLVSSPGIYSLKKIPSPVKSGFEGFLNRELTFFS
jgi:hypothetical protein